jgi:hypothetical protein
MPNKPDEKPRQARRKDPSERLKNWLCICEETNQNITGTRGLMLSAVPKGRRGIFVVPSMYFDTLTFYDPIFRRFKPEAVLLNSDYAMFETQGKYMKFLELCEFHYLDIKTRLFVINQRWEKRIYRDNQFDWYSRANVWDEEKDINAGEEEQYAEY